MDLYVCSVIRMYVYRMCVTYVYMYVLCINIESPRSCRFLFGGLFKPSYTVQKRVGLSHFSSPFLSTHDFSGNF